MILQPSERLTRKITIDRHTQNKINIIHKEQDRERFSAFPKPYGGACPRRTVFKYYSRVNYNLSANEPKAPSGRGLRRWRRWRRVRCNIISPSHYITRAPSTARRSPFLPEEGFLFVRICSIVTLNYNLVNQIYSINRRELFSHIKHSPRIASGADLFDIKFELFVGNCCLISSSGIACSGFDYLLEIAA